MFLVSGLTAGAGHHVSRGVHFLHDGHHPGGLGGGGGGGAAETQDAKEWINLFVFLFCLMRIKLMIFNIMKINKISNIQTIR